MLTRVFLLQKIAKALLGATLHFSSRTPRGKGRFLLPLLLGLSILTLLSVVIGSLCAFFLNSLQWVTTYRLSHPRALFFLPGAGLLLGLLYHYYGRACERGNNLILEQIHQPGGGLPKRMTPLILFATLLTHLFGGSVGREGTAIQMGGSIASTLATCLKLPPEPTKLLLLSGVAAGFGAVFGTPLAGALFALEVLQARLFFRLDDFPILLIVSIVATLSARAWGIHHFIYQFSTSIDHPFLSPSLLLKAALLGLGVAIILRIFIATEHLLHLGFEKTLPYPPLRPLVGGFSILALVALLGTQSYLGLGEYSSSDASLLTIESFFQSTSISPWTWWWKLLFTALTLGSGFKGGEVTPLFFMGAAFGNTLGGILGVPADLFAALGLVAIFAGATKTPFTSLIMSLELFGVKLLLPMIVASFCSYFLSGQRSIFPSQRRH